MKKIVLLLSKYSSFGDSSNPLSHALFDQEINDSGILFILFLKSTSSELAISLVVQPLL